MSRCNNLIALAAIVAAALFSGCHTDSASRAAPIPEATPAVRLVKQQGVELLQFNASDVPGLSIVQVAEHRYARLTRDLRTDHLRRPQYLDDRFARRGPNRADARLAVGQRSAR